VFIVVITDPVTVFEVVFSGGSSLSSVTEISYISVIAWKL